MRFNHIALLALLTITSSAIAQGGPKYGKNGGIGSSTSTYQDGEPVGGTYAINGTTGLMVSRGAEVVLAAPTATALSGLPSGLRTVLRLGHTTRGDAPPLAYTASNAGCSISGGDTGSQVPTSDGKCWIASFGSEADIRQWGLQPGGQADTAMNRAVAYACVTHTPISIPYPGSNPYLLNSSIVVGNGSGTTLSTCNGVTLKVSRPYNESTSGTTPPNYMTFRWNGTGANTIPFVAKGPAAQISFLGLSVNCANPSGVNANNCKTGIEINNIVEGRFHELGVAGNTNLSAPYKPGLSIISTPVNIWPTGMEGSEFSSISVAAPGPGGAGLDFGITDCTACSPTDGFAVIANTFNNVVANFDGTVAGAYGAQFGLIAQSTLTNLRISCTSGSISGDCSPALGDAIKITPVVGRTMFPTDLMFIHPLINGKVNDPGASWTGDQGLTFINWSTAYRGFPVSINFDLFKGNDSQGRKYPAARNWTPTDSSGAGLALTVADATYTVNGNTCSVSLAVTYPSTANTNSAALAGLPFRCAPSFGSGTARMGGSVAYSTVGSPVTALVDSSGAIGFYNASGAAYNNAALSGKIIRFTLTWPLF